MKSLLSSAKKTFLFSSSTSLATLSLLAILSGVSCTETGLKPKVETKNTSNSQQNSSVELPGGNLGSPKDGKIELAPGQTVEVVSIDGVDHIPVQGIPTQSNVEATQFQNALSELQAKSLLVALKRDSQTGYFSAYIPLEKYHELKTIYGLGVQFLVNPVVTNSQDHISVKRLSEQISAEVNTEGVIGNSNFSGLKRIGEPEFRALVQKEIGDEKVDGSLVKVGVTDTGVTYNHPAFENAKGKSRVTYMKDFTSEGRVYFSPLSKFKATVKEGAENIFIVDAKISSLKVGRDLPGADEFETIKNLEIIVNEDLKSELLSSERIVHLGILAESSFANEAAGELVDIDGNKKADDKFWVFYAADKDGKNAKAYLNLATGSGNTDFSNVKALRDFNESKDVVSAFSEKFGLEFKSVTLQTKKDKPQEVQSISVVGYDPGNHGSHVSGIIAARKTLSNDSENTLARGVVPNAELMVNRVCANNGGCQAQEAMIDLAKNGAEVINMSLGGLGTFNDGFDVQSLLVNRLSQIYNSLFIISAGNSGPGRNTVGSPSVASLSLSVGASASRALISKQYGWPGSGKVAEETNPTSDFMLFFSSRGPTSAGGFKPNIAAPGTELSTIQLNATPGSRPGLDVYWGTSMAAPTASGAAALLLDAAKKYNLKFPTATLKTDALTLRRVLIDSAKPFDVASFDPKTGKSTKGQYTWIDQGTGLLNLPRAWNLLKKHSETQLPAPFTAAKKASEQNGEQMDVRVEYGVRVLAKNPNDLSYDGTLPSSSDPLAGDKILTPRFGTGIWIDSQNPASLYEVQLTRRLPGTLAVRSDAGELLKKLNTTGETFVLETKIYGSQTNWLKAGVPNALDCTNAEPLKSITIVGPGAVDVITEGQPTTSLPLRASNLNVCVNQALLKDLPPGDHGAIVKAYRIHDGKKEATASFEVPVSLAVPHKTLGASEKYVVEGAVKSFAVSRNYVKVPAGTSLVTVTLEVPELNVDGLGCSGAELMALEGANTLIPAELSPRSKAIASNCTASGAANTADKRKVTFTRVAPKAGIWDLHVFGRYNFPLSKYKLTVEYANVKSSLNLIAGGVEKASGTFELSVTDSSFAVDANSAASTYELVGLQQTVRDLSKQGENTSPKSKAGSIARSYDSAVDSVVYQTNGATGSDLDLDVLECDDAEFLVCNKVASSGGSTDVESAEFKPVVGKFYKPVVIGYEVAGGSAEFNFIETIKLANKDVGSVAVAKKDEKNFGIDYSLDTNASALLKDLRFISNDFQAVGSVVVKDVNKVLLAEVPIILSAKPDELVVGK